MFDKLILGIFGFPTVPLPKESLRNVFFGTESCLGNNPWPRELQNTLMSPREAYFVDKTQILLTMGNN